MFEINQEFLEPKETKNCFIILLKEIKMIILFSDLPFQLQIFKSCQTYFTPSSST